ncbi:MAG: PilZ domain-containing protein [Hyphomicrobium sp.]
MPTSTKIRAAKPTVADLRFAPRRQRKIPAFVYLDGVVAAIPCMIVDISTTGARLEMKTGWDSAFKSFVNRIDRVRLVERIEKVAYECSVVRCGDLELAVRFTAPPVLPPMPVPGASAPRR